MIVARLLGGLGNQMFQYAFGRALASRLGAELRFDASEFASSGARRYMLDPFNVGAPQFASAAEIRGYVHAGRIGRRLTDYWMRTKPVAARRYYKEPGFHYDPAYLQLSDDVYVDGYWQSPRYFSAIEDDLRDEFTPKRALSDHSARVLEQIQRGNAVSVHVRCGDYLSRAATSKVHGICGPAYYASALQQIAEQVERPRLFVFSDDLAWTRDHIRFPAGTTFVEGNGTERAFEDMWLMSRCRHQVIANSSFSWWAAWLNPSRGKIVIAPRQWFRKSGIDTRDLIPSAWVRVGA